MIHDVLDPRQAAFLAKLSGLPLNINKHKDRQNLIEFVLHELCHHNCLNLKKAAYFVDNKDFNCLHGIAGVDNTERFAYDDIWTVPDEFSSYMNSKAFNSKVKELRCESSKCVDDEEKKLMDKLGQELGMEGGHYCIVPLKYDNKGIFVYEPIDHALVEAQGLEKGLSFLTLCPLF